MKAFLLLMTLMLPTYAFAGAMNEGKLYDVLFPYFVLAVVFEVALAPLFNWRIFLLHFEGKVYKTPITIVLAYVTFSAANLDIFGEILMALGHGYSPVIENGVPKEVTSTWWGQFLTAFLIAGGSSGINQIFSKIGIRTPELNKRKAQESRIARDLEQAGSGKTPEQMAREAAEKLGIR